jgi:hypothetical protein
MKKAELSLSVVVMAVIAVLVLIILSSLLVRNIGIFSEGLQQCPGGPSQCSPLGTCNGDEIAKKTNCDANSKVAVCCIPLTKTPR